MNPLADHLRAMKERLERATPGPWFVAEEPFDDRSTAVYGDNTAQVACDPHGARFVVDCDVTMEWTEGEPDQSVFDRANAQLIAHAPTDIARLIRAVECAVKALESGRGQTINQDNAMEMYWRDSLRYAETLREIGAILKGEE